MHKKLVVTLLFSAISTSLLSACNSGATSFKQAVPAPISSNSLKNIEVINQLNSKIEALLNEEVDYYSDDAKLEIIKGLHSIKDTWDGPELQNLYKNMFLAIYGGQPASVMEAFHGDLKDAKYTNKFGSNPVVLKALAGSLAKVKLTDDSQSLIAYAISEGRFGNDPSVLNVLANRVANMQFTDSDAQISIERAIKEHRFGDDEKVLEDLETKVKNWKTCNDFFRELDQDDEAKIDELYNEYSNLNLVQQVCYDYWYKFYRVSDNEKNEEQPIKGRINFGNPSSDFSEYQLKKFTILLIRFIQDNPNTGIYSFKHLRFPIYQERSRGDMYQKEGRHVVFDNQITIYFDNNKKLDQIKQTLKELDAFLMKSEERDKRVNKFIDIGSDIPVGFYTSYRNELATTDGNFDFSIIPKFRLRELVIRSETFLANNSEYQEVYKKINSEEDTYLKVYHLVRIYNSNKKFAQDIGKRWSSYLAT